MDEPRELELLLRALRAGVLDPSRLTAAATQWPDPARPGFMRFLSDRGDINGPLHGRPEPPTATFAPDPSPLGASPHATTSDFQPGTATPGETPTFAPSAVPSQPIPTSVGGRYQLIRLHRTGGLGQVWLAHDTALGREVALKMMRPDRQADAASRARFVREAQLTGRLEHPTIVPLHDLIDSDDGRGPCYAMRFVAGRTLAEAVAAYHRDRLAGRAGPLDLAALLDAFVAVCQAVAFAHSQNVLHRDVKGQNVVLGDFGEVFLLDWGLGKDVNEQDTPAPSHVSATADTRPGSIVGTPAFMAPELAAGGPASKATDVYGLVAVLYMILSGKPPYDGPTPDDVLEKVRTTEPQPVPVHNSAAPAALEAIRRRAMARDPAARYASADELATDVRRWLADEPVSVYREPWLVRASRWARRHRTTVAAAAVFLVTAVIALSITAALVWREQQHTEQQKAAAEREWRRAEAESARAERNFATARTLIVDLSGRIGALETGRAEPRSVDLARQAALKIAVEAFDRFRSELPDDVAVRTQTAAMLRYAANVSRLLGDFTAADKAYDESLRILEELADRQPDDATHRDNLAQTLRDRAMLQKRLGKLRESAATMDRANDLADGLKGRLPESSYRRTLGVVLIDRADVEYTRGEFASSERSASRAQELIDGLRDLPADQATPLDALLAAVAVNQMAMARREQDRVEDALKAHEDGVARVKAMAGPNAGRDVMHYFHRVRLERARTWLRLAARRMAAADELGEVIKGWEALGGEYPSLALYQEWLARALLVRGELHLLASRPAPAAADFERARAIYAALIGRHKEVPDFRGLLGIAFHGLSRVAAANGKPADAADWLDKADRILKLAEKMDPDNAHHRRAREEVEKEAKPGKP